MQNKLETNDFEKIKTAIFILAQAIENGRIQGVCHDVTEALYPDSEVVNQSELDQPNT
jgi:hypothetical protein